MAAGKYTFLCEQGATFDPVITWRQPSPDPDADPPVPGDPVDLTGYTARMQVRKKITDTDVVITLTTENNRIVLGGASGEIMLLIDDTDTTPLPAGSWKYDLELESAGGITTRLLKGTFKVDPEVTRTP